MSTDDIFKKYSDQIDITPPEKDNEDSVMNLPGVTAVDEEFIDALPLYPYFGLDEKADKYNTKRNQRISFINQFVNGDLKSLESIENRIGPPKLGVNRVDNLYNYFRLNQQAGDLVDRITSYGNQDSDNESGRRDSSKSATKDDGGSSSGKAGKKGK